MALFGLKKRKQESRPPVHLIMVSHEASLTGAPKIALNLMRQFRDKTSAELTTILHDGGPLQSEFDAVSPTICLDVPREHHPTIHSRVRQLLRPLEKSGQKVICICNSAESRFVANSMFTRNIPILYLLHEFPTSYPVSEFEKITQYSDHIVFPCRSVLNATRQIVSVPKEQSSIHPQGLLDKDFGTRYETKKARIQLRKRLNLPDDAFIVLGCGTIDLRKGIDHFVSVARTHKTLGLSDRPVHFVWLGDGPRHPHSAHHYVSLDIHKSGQSNVTLAGEVTNVEPFFSGADSFLLTSRVDPFPCVIHEAMAARLPIMLFNESGGASEAVGETAAIKIPFGDYVETSRIIDRLETDSAFGESFASNGFERVHKEYRFDDYADKIIDLCEQQLSRQIRNDSISFQNLPKAKESHPINMNQQARVA